MNNELNAQGTAQLGVHAQDSLVERASERTAPVFPRAPWRRPVVTRLPMRRTMLGSGPTDDGAGSSTVG
jgi:hypothetical protein